MSLSYPQEWGGKPKGTPRITTNRTMIRKTFNQKGLGYASELALQNCLDLEKIIEWNEQHQIKFYRMSSNLFPWASEYRFEQLPDYEEIADSLKRSGDLAAKYGQRITTHPGPFNKLTSPRDKVIQNTITDLEIHGKIFDMMGLRTPRSTFMSVHTTTTSRWHSTTFVATLKNYLALCALASPSRTMTKLVCIPQRNFMKQFMRELAFRLFLIIIIINFVMVDRTRRKRSLPRA